MDFSSITDGYVVVRAKANANTSFTIRDKSEKGKVMAKLTITVEGETGPFRRSMKGQWMTLTVPVEYVPKGITNLCVVCEGPEVCIDWLQFKNRTTYLKPATSTSALPDAEGFIRRWMLLEPIKQDIRSNVIFTNTWLRDTFAKQYFDNQMTILPKDGQKVKVDNQKLVSSGASRDGISVRRSGIAKVLWRELNTEVPASKVIVGGVDIYKG